MNVKGTYLRNRRLRKKLWRTKINDKERILKAAREKETVTYKGVP